MNKNCAMATECTQEAVLEFLIDKGGRVRQKELSDHFKVFFTSDNKRRTTLKESFKRFVDNIAFVRRENGEKFVCLKKKYRDPDERSEQPEGEEYNGEEEEEESARKKEAYLEKKANGVHRGASQKQKSCFSQKSITSSLGDDGSRGASKRPEAELCLSEIALTEVTGSSTDSKCAQDAGQVTDKGVGGGKIDDTEVVASGGAVVAQDAGRRRLSRGARRSLTPALDDGEAELQGGEASECTTKAGRRGLLRSGSPQARRPLVHRSSQAQMVVRRQDSVKSEGDSSSVPSVAGEDCASVMLDPLEHEWMMCASDGEWESLRQLLDSEPGLIVKKDFVTGFTCLHWAAKQGKHELLAMLVTYAQQHSVAVNVNARSSAGYTPLHLAAMHNHVEVMKLLVGAYDADLEVRDYSGRKPSQYLDVSVAEDIRDIIGACEDPEPDTGEGTAGRWRLSKVLQSNLNPLRLLNLAEDMVGDGQAKIKPLYRKSSISRIKLNRSMFKSQIVHSTSFRETEEDVEALKSPGKSRPVSNLFG